MKRLIESEDRGYRGVGHKLCANQPRHYPDNNSHPISVIRVITLTHAFTEKRFGDGSHDSSEGFPAFPRRLQTKLIDLFLDRAECSFCHCSQRINIENIANSTALVETFQSAYTITQGLYLIASPATLAKLPLKIAESPAGGNLPMDVKNYENSPECVFEGAIDGRNVRHVKRPDLCPNSRPKLFLDRHRNGNGNVVHG